LPLPLRPPPAPPPGHTIGFNDGVGTGPGHPGAQGGNGYRPPRREDMVVSQNHVEGVRGETPAAAATHRNSTQKHAAAPGQAMAGSSESAPGQAPKALYAASSDSGASSSLAGGLHYGDSADATAAGSAGSDGQPERSWLHSTDWARIEQRAWDQTGGQQATVAVTASVAGRWEAVQQSMERESAESGVTYGSSGGNDLAALRGWRLISSDVLNSQRVSASDPIGLQAGLQRFQGLGQGVQEIA